MPDFSCAAVVLAAGASSRLGQPKQLVTIEGETLLHRTVRLALEADCFPVVVVGFEAERMRAALDDLSCVPVVNEDWASGMGSSLRCGMDAVTGLETVPNDVLLLVCDQLALGVRHLRKLLRVHGRNPLGITASLYGGLAGVPALFSSAYFPELRAVRGDRGARGILAAHPEAIHLVDFPDGVLDLDIPEQLP